MVVGAPVSGKPPVSCSSCSAWRAFDLFVPTIRDPAAAPAKGRSPRATAGRSRNYMPSLAAHPPGCSPRPKLRSSPRRYRGIPQRREPGARLRRCRSCKPDGTSSSPRSPRQRDVPSRAFSFFFHQFLLTIGAVLIIIFRAGEERARRHERWQACHRRLSVASRRSC